MPKIVRTQICVTEDAAKGSALDLLVQGYHEGVSPARLLQADVTAALADDLPSLILERLDEAPAGNHRLVWIHAGSGILRRITPLSSGSPSSRSPST